LKRPTLILLFTAAMFLGMAAFWFTPSPEEAVPQPTARKRARERLAPNQQVVSVTPNPTHLIENDYENEDAQVEDPYTVPLWDAAPVAVLSLLRQNGSHGGSLEEAYRQWARMAPQAAVEHALFYLRGDLRLNVAKAAILEWMQRDPTTAAAHLASLITPNHDYFINTVARSYAAIDPAAAMQWALGAAPAETRNGAVQHAMITWLTSAPADAIAWAEALANSQRLMNRPEQTALWEATMVLVSHNFEQARQYVERLPLNEAKWAATNALIEHWSGKDPTTAAHWLSNLPVNENLDITRALAASRVRETDYAVAQQLVSNITQPEIRQKLGFP
jgi:hypothetical protein